MARQIASSVENNFINGFVTEATALNFPESASVDALDVTFKLRGNVVRRQGYDFESSSVTHSRSLTDKAVTTYYWKAAGGSGLWNFIVKQIGTELFFYKISEGSLSSGLMPSSIDLSGLILGDTPSQTEFQFASGRGYLFVCHPQMDPVYVHFDQDAQSFSYNTITIRIRDFEGIADSFKTDYRPTHDEENTNYKYNIYNQGWAPFNNGGVEDLSNSGFGVSSSSAGTAPPNPNYVGDPYRTWKENRNDLPSYADVWWLCKDSLEQFQPKLASANSMGNSPAPKGHFILYAFYQDRSNESGLSGIPVTQSGIQKPSTVAFFAGRAFYAGVNHGAFSNKVYFSQIVKNDAQFGLCYQQNDPTSEHTFDLLATDGGEISILDCGQIIKLVSIQSSLIVFATNGVWAISGSAGIGFSATDFTVRKISSIPSISASSFVDVAGTPCWWNTDGIYIVSGADALGSVQITSMTEKKIKAFFTDNIPAENKTYAKGVFNTLTKVIHWSYRSTPETSISDRYTFDRVLNFNTITGAFFIWSFPSVVSLNGIIAYQGTATTTALDSVTDDSDALVTTNSDTPVQVVGSTTAESACVTKFLVSQLDQGTFAEERNGGYIDFPTVSGGTDYTSYLVSGFKVHGDAQRKFQANYLYLFCENSEQNEFHFQSVWDYANDPVSGDFGSKQYVTWNSTPRDYVFRRLKIRGSGISLQFKVTSMTGRPFNIVGWSTFETGNAAP